MEADQKSNDLRKLSLGGMLITLGIVFGDLGTSPLYAMKAIIAGANGGFNELLVYGGLSCIFWTLTLITTIKYIVITLRADNNGEGGIFALYALLKERSSWAAILTMVGGAALLADGIISPAITVTSSIEGLRLYNPDIPVIPIVLVILGFLFFIQQFGTKVIGSSFGPIMVIWFVTLGLLGLVQIMDNPHILEAVSPVYAYRFLAEYPGGFILLGAVFLATTGAEALYADLGHCGRKNIQVTWVFVKIALLLNYFGQGAWLLNNHESVAELNPFFNIMPDWFLLPGIILATTAAVIASQAIISGSFTLIGEAVSLNFWPKIKVLHPTWIRGQVYIPFVNWFLWISCSLVVLFFKEAAAMNAAYGMAIIMAEIVTTLLLAYYLFTKGVNHRLVLVFLMTFLTIEGSFLIANLYKFANGAWLTILLSGIYITIMIGWYFGRKIKNRYITFADLDEHLDLFRDLIKDESVPKYASNLVYIIRANRHDQVESKVIYSIFRKQPKRADRYWLLHVNRVNDPKKFEYTVNQIIPGRLIRVDFQIGFKVEPKINLYFREVVEDLVKSGELTLESSYPSLRNHEIESDFKFVLIDRIMTRDFNLTTMENFILGLNSIVRKLSIPEIRNLSLDSTNTIIEQVPIVIDEPVSNRIVRVQ